MSTKNKQIVALAGLLKKYQNKWVAFDSSGSKVLASGKTVAEVEKNIKSNKNKVAKISFINEFGFYTSPHAHI